LRRAIVPDHTGSLQYAPYLDFFEGLNVNPLALRWNYVISEGADNSVAMYDHFVDRQIAPVLGY
jgi:hypothetical protein